MEKLPSTLNTTTSDEIAAKKAEFLQVEKRVSRFNSRRRSNLEAFKLYKHDLGVDTGVDKSDQHRQHHRHHLHHRRRSGVPAAAVAAAAALGDGEQQPLETRLLHILGGGDALLHEPHKKKRTRDFSHVDRHGVKKNRPDLNADDSDENDIEENDRIDEIMNDEANEKSQRSSHITSSTNIGNVFFSAKSNESATMKKCLLRANQFKQEKLKKKLHHHHPSNSTSTSNPPVISDDTVTTTNIAAIKSDEIPLVSHESKQTEEVKLNEPPMADSGQKKGKKKSRKVIRKQSCMELIYDRQKSINSTSSGKIASGGVSGVNNRNEKALHVQLESKMKDIDLLRESIATEIANSYSSKNNDQSVAIDFDTQNVNSEKDHGQMIHQSTTQVLGTESVGSAAPMLELPETNDFDDVTNYYNLPVMQKLILAQREYWKVVGDNFRKSGGLIKAREVPEESYDSIAAQLWEPHEGRPPCALAAYGQCQGQLTMRHDNEESFALMAYFTPQQLQTFIETRRPPDEDLLCEFCHRFNITLQWKSNPCDQNFTFQDEQRECDVHHTYKVGQGNYAYDGMLAQSGKMKTHGVFGLVRAWDAGDFVAVRKEIEYVDTRDGCRRRKFVRGWRETKYLFSMNSNRSTICERADPMERSVVRPSEPMNVQWFLRCYFSQNIRNDHSSSITPTPTPTAQTPIPPVPLFNAPSTTTTTTTSNNAPPLNAMDFKKREQKLNQQLRSAKEIEAVRPWFVSIVHRCAFEEFYDLFEHIDQIDWTNEEFRYFWTFPLHALDPQYVGERMELLPTNSMKTDSTHDRNHYFELNHLPAFPTHRIYFTLLCKLNALQWMACRKNISIDVKQTLDVYYNSFVPLLRWMFSDYHEGASRMQDVSILSETIPREVAENVVGSSTTTTTTTAEEHVTNHFIPIIQFYPPSLPYDDPRFYHFIEWKRETFSRPNAIEEILYWYGESRDERTIEMKARKIEIEPFIAPLRNSKVAKAEAKIVEAEIERQQRNDAALTEEEIDKRRRQRYRESEENFIPRTDISFDLFSSMLERINFSSIVKLQKHAMVERFIAKFSAARANLYARRKFEQIYEIVARQLYLDEKELAEYISTIYFEKIFTDFRTTVAWVASRAADDCHFVDILIARSKSFRDLFSSKVKLTIPQNWREVNQYNIIVAAFLRVWVAERIHELECAPKSNVFKHGAKHLERVIESDAYGGNNIEYRETKQGVRDFGLATVRFALMKFRNAHLDLISLVREGKDGDRAPLITDEELRRHNGVNERKFSSFDILYPYPSRDVHEGVLSDDSNALLYVDFINETGMKWSIWNKIKYKLPDRCCSGRNGDDILDAHCVSNPAFYRLICLELELSLKGAYLHCNQRPRFATTLELHRVFKNLYATTCRRRIMQIMIRHHKLTMFALSESLVYLLSKNTALFEMLNEVYPEWYGERVKCNMDIARIALDETWSFDETDHLLFDKVNLERNKRVYRHLASDFIEYLCKQIEKLDVERYEQAQYFKDKRYKTNKIDRTLIERIVHNSNPQDVVDLSPLQALRISDATMMNIVRMNRIFYEHKSQKEIQHILKSLNLKEYNLISFFLETLKRYRAIRTISINNFDVVSRQMRALEKFYVSSVGERPTDGISMLRLMFSASLCCKQAQVLISNTVDSQGSGFQGITESQLRNGQVCKRKEDRLKKKRKAEGKKVKRVSADAYASPNVPAIDVPRVEGVDDYEETLYNILFQGDSTQSKPTSVIVNSRSTANISGAKFSFASPSSLASSKKSAPVKMRRLTRRKNQTEEAYQETIAKAQKIEKKTPLCNETKIIFVPAAGCVVECSGYKIPSGKKSNAKSRRNAATKKNYWNIVRHPECERTVAFKQQQQSPPNAISIRNGQLQLANIQATLLAGDTDVASSAPDPNLPQPYRVLTAEEVRQIHETKVGTVFTRTTILKHHYKKKLTLRDSGGGGGGVALTPTARVQRGAPVTPSQRTNAFTPRNTMMAVDNFIVPSPITLVNLYRDNAPNCIFDHFDRISNLNANIGSSNSNGAGGVRRTATRKPKKPTSTKTTIENLWKQSGSPFFISPCCGRWTSYRVFNFTPWGYACGSCSKMNSVVMEFRKPVCIVCFNADIELANSTWHLMRVYDDLYTGRRTRYYFCNFCMSSDMMHSRNFLDVPLSIMCKGINRRSYLDELLK